MNLYCLHGFLGLPSDWDVFNFKFSGINQVVAIDLLKNNCQSFDRWSSEFNKMVENHENKFNSQKKPILMGYSLGGRLALHALISKSEIYSSAIIISTNYGIESLEERKKRLNQDLKWSKAFLSEPWEILMNRWNSQSVFKNMSSFVRYEEKYSRKKLAEALEIWSLGNQEFLKKKVENLTIPILWCVGEHDLKFLELAKKIDFANSKSKVTLIKNGAHRAPWENSEDFIFQIKEWFYTVN